MHPDGNTPFRFGLLKAIAALLLVALVAPSFTVLAEENKAADQSLTALAKAEAYASFEFPARNVRYDVYEADIFMNDVKIGALKGVVPMGRYIFPVPGETLKADGKNKMTFQVTRPLNPSHTKPIINFTLLTSAASKKFVVAGSREEAEKLAVENNDDTNYSLPDVALFADPEFNITSTPKDGEKVTIRVIVANLGAVPSEKVFLRAGSAASIPTVELQPLAPHEFRSVDLEATWKGEVSKINNSVLILAESGEDHDPTNNDHRIVFFSQKEEIYERLRTGDASAKAELDSAYTRPEIVSSSAAEYVPPADTLTVRGEKREDARPLALDSPMTVLFDRTRWFKASAPGDGYLVLTRQPAGTGKETGIPNVEVYAEGSEDWKATDFLWYEDDKFIFPVDKETVFIKVVPFSNSWVGAVGKDQSRISLKFIAETDKYEPNNTFETAKSVSLNQDFPLVITDRDSDYFKIHLPAAGYLSFSKVGWGDAFQDRPSIYLYNSKKEMISRAERLQAGDYFVEFEPMFAFSDRGDATATPRTMRITFSISQSFLRPEPLKVLAASEPRAGVIEAVNTARIDRTFNQYSRIKVQNPYDRPLRVEASIKGETGDIIAEFSGKGSMDEPLVLPPKASDYVLLGIFAQLAKQDAYALPVIIKDAETGEVVDESRVDVSFNEESDPKFDIQEIGQDLATLAKIYQVVNRSKTGQTFSLEIGEDLGGKMSAYPWEKPEYLFPGESYTFKIVPTLSEDFSGLNGGFVIKAGDTLRDIPVSFKLPEGSSVYPVTMSTGGMRPMQSIRSSERHCGNQKFFDVLFNLGKMNPWDFIDGLNPLNPLLDGRSMFWDWFGKYRDSALAWYDEAIGKASGPWKTFLEMSRWLAGQGTQGKMEFLATAAIPWGKLAQWGLTGNTGRVSLLDAQKALGILGDANAVKGVPANVLDDLFRSYGGSKAPWGFADLKNGVIYFDADIAYGNPFTAEMIRLHEAAHIAGASEYGAFRVASDYFRSLPFSQQLVFLREPAAQRALRDIFGFGYMPNIYSIFRAPGYGGSSSFFSFFSPFKSLIRP